MPAHFPLRYSLIDMPAIQSNFCAINFIPSAKERVGSMMEVDDRGYEGGRYGVSQEVESRYVSGICLSFSPPSRPSVSPCLYPPFVEIKILRSTSCLHHHPPHPASPLSSTHLVNTIGSSYLYVHERFGRRRTTRLGRRVLQNPFLMLDAFHVV